MHRVRKVWYYHCDLEQNDERIELLGLIENEHKTLNVLINTAAFVGASDLQGWITSLEEQTIETWRRALGLISLHHFICVKD